ncbi:MAG: hypothetical protein GY805_25000 [Chloroflexi bacterium]|nr:hypothetical protein [Chloroflexota bacterium]
MKAISYQLDLLEPALLTAPGGDPNTDESLDYIPGSVMRGALAHQYRRANLPDADFKRLFLNGSTRFLNAYPAYEDERMLPMPAHWRRKKDAKKDEKRIYNMSQDEVKTSTSVGGPFMVVKDKLVYAKRPQHEVAVHNARNRDKGRAIPNDPTNRSALFRYHALAAQQSFLGQILVADKDAGRILSLLKGDLLLGGSNTAGYGLTQIVQAAELDPAKMREKQDAYAGIPAGTPLFVYLTSDAIVRHPDTGQPGAYLAETLAALLPGHKLEVLNSYGRMGWVGGFNVKWGLPLPQTWSLLKGSVWQMESDQTIAAADVEQIEQRGIGDRRTEGFGALLLLPQTAWPDKLHVSERLTTTIKQPRGALEFPDLSDLSTRLLEKMNRQVAQKELDRHLMATVSDMKKRSIRLSNSQLARLRLKVRQEIGKPAEKFKRFRQYLNGTEVRKSVDDQFRKSRFQGQNFRKWLNNLASRPELVWENMDLKRYGWEKSGGEWQRPLLGKDPFRLTNEMAHQYAIRLIEAICEQTTAERRTR